MTVSQKELIIELASLLESALGLKSGAISPHAESLVLGAIPEFDSMAAVNLIVNLEEEYDIVIHDDEVDGETFSSLGSMATYLQQKIGA